MKKTAKWNRLIHLLMVILVVSTNVFAQEEDPTPEAPESQMIAAFSHENCEIQMANSDLFANALQDNPTATGYALIRGRPLQFRTSKKEIESYFDTKGLDKPTIVRIISEADPPNVEYWLVPVGADMSSVVPEGEKESGETLEQQLASVKKPFIFETQGSGSVCPETYTDVYADMLKAAKSSRGNIVFYQPTRRAYQNARKELLKELVDLGIERKRLRTFWVKGSFPGDEGTELWFLP